MGTQKTRWGPHEREVTLILARYGAPDCHPPERPCAGISMERARRVGLPPASLRILLSALWRVAGNCRSDDFSPLLFPEGSLAAGRVLHHDRDFARRQPRFRA